MHTQLLVTVIEGRNLAPKDSNGLSDPFVTMKLGKVKQSTGIHYKTLHPVFGDQSYPFTIESVSDVLRIQCWDHDTVKDDFMGRIDIPIGDIQAEIKFKTQSGNGYFQRWYELKSRGKLHIDGPITGDLLLKFEIVGAKVTPVLSRRQSEANQVGAQLIMQLQQSQIDAGDLDSISIALESDSSLQKMSIILGAMTLLKIHLSNNLYNIPVLTGVLHILSMITHLEEAAEKIVELGYISILYSVPKYHPMSHTSDSRQLFVEWTQVMNHLSKYAPLKGRIIDTSHVSLFIKILDNEDMRIVENGLEIICQHVLSNGVFPFNPILDFLENMLEYGPAKIKFLCVQLLVLFSSRPTDKTKLLSLIEPLIKLLGSETMTDSILQILLNVSNEESIRVFIVEEGGITALEGISCSGSPQQRKTTKEILNQFKCH